MSTDAHDPLTELLIAVSLSMGVFAIGVSTGAFLSLALVRSAVRKVPMQQEVMIRMGGDLLGSMQAVQSIIQISAVVAGVLLLGGAVVARRDHVKRYYRGVFVDE